MKRVVITVILVLPILVGCFFIPFIPEEIPNDQWSNGDFPAVKLRLERAAEKLDAMALELRRRGPELPETYNLIATRGSTTKRRTLFGAHSVGSSEWNTWAFGTHILPSVPHLIYDHENLTARITPQQLGAFLDWVERATIYPQITTNKKQNKAEEPTPNPPSD